MLTPARVATSEATIDAVLDSMTASTTGLEGSFSITFSLREEVIALRDEEEDCPTRKGRVDGGNDWTLLTECVGDTTTKALAPVASKPRQPKRYTILFELASDVRGNASFTIDCVILVLFVMKTADLFRQFPL
mmetsp:Transcript_10570/g.21967  ORF Transcript_10570/g.21967 Transcript_10570/m.21967 type:complete len:133 (-) Transcript_10570:58-456(-)